jgi:hypothetical protein
LFHDHGFGDVEFESEFTKHGPVSWNNPIIEELPGPPFNQMVRGEFAGSLRLSKNQKKRLTLSGCGSIDPMMLLGICTYPEYELTFGVFSQILFYSSY